MSSGGGDQPLGTTRNMDGRAFRELGYLQEVNRLLLHPLGLALAICCDEATGAPVRGPLGPGTFVCTVIDRRDDPEGIVFDELTEEDVLRGQRIYEELTSRLQARLELLGSAQQDLVAGPVVFLNDDEGEAVEADARVEVGE